ncbi:MAG: hypothetical protein ABWY00_02900 [Dongiaceae bacterium]
MSPDKQVRRIDRHNLLQAHIRIITVRVRLLTPAALNGIATALWGNPPTFWNISKLPGLASVFPQ